MNNIKRKCIGVDMDETLNDLMTKILEAYNKKYNDNVKFEDLKNYNVGNFIKPECKNIFAEFCTEELMENLEIDNKAIEVLIKLSKVADVFFITAGHPATAKARDFWLDIKIPFYKSNMLIMCQHKKMIKLDYLIDDFYGNMEDATYRGILISKPWNIDVSIDKSRVSRVKDWSEIELLLKQEGVL